MNEKKAKVGVNAMSIVGLVFTIIGAIFLVLGIALGIGLRSELGMESFVFLFTFGGMGSLFFTLGLVFLITLGNQKKNAQRLLDNGNYVVAEIFDISQNYNVSVNGRHPFVVSCKYEAVDGTVHIFKSRYLYFNPEPLLKNNVVRVYVDNDNFKKYYVDIDEVLPTIVEH